MYEKYLSILLFYSYPIKIGHTYTYLHTHTHVLTHTDAYSYTHTHVLTHAYPLTNVVVGAVCNAEGSSSLQIIDSGVSELSTSSVLAQY